MRRARATTVVAACAAGAGGGQGERPWPKWRAKVALSGKSQAVIVAVPKGFVRADASLGARASVAGDWQFFFNDWLKKRGARVPTWWWSRPPS